MTVGKSAAIAPTIYLYCEVSIFAISLPASIEKLAKCTGRTKTFYAREAILKRIEDLEDVYAAERVLERVRAGKENAQALAEVAKHLDLED